MLKTLALVSVIALAGCDPALWRPIDWKNMSPEQTNMAIGILNATRPPPLMGVPQTYDPYAIGMIGRASSPIYVCPYGGCL